MTSFSLVERAAVMAGLIAFAGCGNGTVTTATAGGSGGSATSGTAGTSGGSSGSGSGSHASSSSSSTRSTASSSSSGVGGSSGGIVDCRLDGGTDCSTLFDVCNPADGNCVQCLSSGDCASLPATPICSTTGNSCVQCNGSGDCPGDDPGCFQGLCGACGTTADCPSGLTCTNGACGCTAGSNTGCTGDAPVCVQLDAGITGCGCQLSSQCSGATCDTQDYQFGACVAGCSGGCSGATPYCDSASGLCAACLNASQCADAGQPDLLICYQDNCVQCVANTDCTVLDAGTPYCVGSACGQCRTYSDCPSSGSKAGCNFVTNTCGSCVTGSDCPPTLTCSGNVCS